MRGIDLDCLYLTTKSQGALCSFPPVCRGALGSGLLFKQNRELTPHVTKRSRAPGCDLTSRATHTDTHTDHLICNVSLVLMPVRPSSPQTLLWSAFFHTFLFFLYPPDFLAAAWLEEEAFILTLPPPSSSLLHVRLLLRLSAAAARERCEVRSLPPWARPQSG